MRSSAIRPLATVFRSGIAGECGEKLLQTGARGDSARPKYDILAIGRDAVRKVGNGCAE